MTLPTFDAQDKIPEAFRSAYIEKDGKWVPNVEDVEGLKGKTKQLLDEKKTLDEQLKALKGVLGDAKPEDIAEILKNHRSSEEDRQRKAGEFDKLLEKRLNEVRNELNPKVEEGDKAKRELADLRFDLAVRKAAAAAGVLEEDMEDVLAIVKGRWIRPNEKDSKKIEVLDADGDVSSKSVEKFFAEDFKKLKPKFYKGSGASGGGAGGGGGGGGGRSGGGSGGTVDLRDTSSFLANLKDVASGKVKAVVGTD